MTEVLKKELKEAQRTLDSLEKELPNFQRLLSDNEAEEKQQKAAKDLEKLTAAKTRVTAVRELIDQHKSDINAARAEVQRLESELATAQKLDKMTAHAAEATKHRTEFLETMEEAAAALEGYLEKLHGSYTALTTARRNFLNVGRAFSSGFGTTHWPMGFDSARVEEERVKLENTLAAIRQQGADPTAALTRYSGYGGSVADLHTLEPLPFPKPYGMVLWQGVMQFAEEEMRQQREQDEATRPKPAPKPEQRESNVNLIYIRAELASEAVGQLGLHLVKNSWRDGDHGVLQVTKLDTKQALDRLSELFPVGSFHLNQQEAEHVAA